MVSLKRSLLFFVTGGIGYIIVELLWRERTHWSMALAGGLSFLLIGVIADKLKKKSIFLKALLSAVAITAVELLFGIVFNIILKMQVWDYSDVRFNFLGQICPLFSFLWFALSFPLIALAEQINKRSNKRENLRTD